MNADPVITAMSILDVSNIIKSAIKQARRALVASAAVAASENNGANSDIVFRGILSLGTNTHVYSLNPAVEKKVVFINCCLEKSFNTSFI